LRLVIFLQEVDAPRNRIQEEYVKRQSTTCQAIAENLTLSSQRHLSPSCALKFAWCLGHRGWATTLHLLGVRASKACRAWGGKGSGGRQESAQEPEALHLQPGERVQVKPEPEIRRTLDEDGRHRGLLWMPDMARFCGGQYRVYKRVERIMLESSGEIRKVSDTVLLEGVMCENLYDCDRSCFHFWREAWLRRVP
jgi:hypothetical protein